MNILTLFKKQIKAHPVTVVFFMIGYFMSTLLLSIGLSNIVHMRDSIIEQNNGIYKDTLTLNISGSKNMKFENIIDTFKNISSGSKIRVNTLSTYVDNDNTNEEFKIIAEYFKSNTNLNFPIMEGQYYTSEDVLNNEKVVLLGKDLEKFTYENDNKQKIKLGGSEYTVIGVIGDSNKASTWDETIFMPITSVPENSKLNYFKFMSTKLLLISESQKEASDLQALINNMKEIDSSSNIESNRTEESKNIFLNLISQNSGMLIISSILFGFSIINIINISSFWINERKIEIGIRKSFGINNLQLFTLLLMEFFSITFVTTIVSLLFQFGMSIVIKNCFEYYLYISKENFILALIMSVISALITVIIPSIKVMKISPIEAIKV